MSSKRAQKRNLLRNIDEATRKRFGRHASFRIWSDVSDSDPDEWDACLHHVKRPANAQHDMMFPATGRAFTARTEIAALEELLKAIEGTAGR